MTLPSFPSRTAAGADGLAAVRKDPGRAVLGLDFDGVLAPIVDKPDDARPHPQALDLLVRLAPVLGAVVIVTGRPVDFVAKVGGLRAVPGLVVLGQYGLERWADGKKTVPEPHPGVAEARAKLPGVIAAAGAPDCVYIEDKEYALAVHTRQCPEPQVTLDRLRGVLEALAERCGLLVEYGRFVAELRPPGMDKGIALRGFLQDAPEPVRHPSAVLYAGDDLGDLKAYDAVDALRAEGVPGLKVCSGSGEVAAELVERADLVVDGPDGIMDLLAELADALS